MKKYVHSFEEFVRINSKRKVNEDENDGNSKELDVDAIVSKINSIKLVNQLTQPISTSSLTINDWIELPTDSKLKLANSLKDKILEIHGDKNIPGKGGKYFVDQMFCSVKNDDNYIYINSEYRGSGSSNSNFQELKIVSKIPISYEGLDSIINSDNMPTDGYKNVTLKFLPVLKKSLIEGNRQSINNRKYDCILPLGYHLSISNADFTKVDDGNTYVNSENLISMSAGNFKDINYINDFKSISKDGIDSVNSDLYNKLG